jgi:hypothetical protein
MVGKAQKSHAARSELNSVFGLEKGTMESHYNIRHTVQISPHAISGLFQPLKGSSEARNFKVTNGPQHVFEKWMECCKMCITCQGRYFEKETVTAPPQSSDSV